MIHTRGVCVYVCVWYMFSMIQTFHLRCSAPKNVIPYAAQHSRIVSYLLGYTQNWCVYGIAQKVRAFDNRNPWRTQPALLSTL